MLIDSAWALFPNEYAEQIEASVHRGIERGFRHIRIQRGGYGSSHLSKEPHFKEAGFALKSDSTMDARPYVEGAVEMFGHIRSTFGEEVELLHDIHERIPSVAALAIQVSCQTTSGQVTTRNQYKVIGHNHWLDGRQRIPQSFGL